MLSGFGISFAIEYSRSMVSAYAPKYCRMCSSWDWGKRRDASGGIGESNFTQGCRSAGPHGVLYPSRPAGAAGIVRIPEARARRIHAAIRGLLASLCLPRFY